MAVVGVKLRPQRAVGICHNDYILNVYKLVYKVHKVTSRSTEVVKSIFSSERVKKKIKQENHGLPASSGFLKNTNVVMATHCTDFFFLQHI